MIIFQRTLFIILGSISLLLGVIGILLPLLPTTPFAILAAYLFSKSSPKLHSWLLNLKYIGPLVKDWEENGVIGKRAKVLCTILIIVLFGSSIFWGDLHIGLNVMLVAIGIGVLSFVLTRPSNPNPNA